MSAALLLTCAVIDEGQTPDWEAAERRIATLTDTGINDPCEVLEPYGCEPEGGEGEHDQAEAGLDIERLRSDLRADLCAFRDGVEDRRADLDYLLIRGAKVWVTGGLSYGDEPSDISAPMRRLHVTGVLAAAGFDGD